MSRKWRRMGAAGRERVAAEFSVALLVSTQEALFWKTVVNRQLFSATRLNR